MLDFRTSSEKKAGWWQETRATVPCILPRDGQLAVFQRKDVENIMDEKYPHSKQQNKIWWFNETKDREIAECDDDRIYANPQVLWTHFMEQSS